MLLLFCVVALLFLQFEWNVPELRLQLLRLIKLLLLLHHLVVLRLLVEWQRRRNVLHVGLELFIR